MRKLANKVYKFYTQRLFKCLCGKHKLKKNESDIVLFQFILLTIILIIHIILLIYFGVKSIISFVSAFVMVAIISNIFIFSYRKYKLFPCYQKYFVIRLIQIIGLFNFIFNIIIPFILYFIYLCFDYYYLVFIYKTFKIIIIYDKIILIIIIYPIFKLIDINRKERMR